MSQNAQASQTGFKTQASMGAFLAPGAAAPNNGVFPRIRSGNMEINRTWLLPDAEMGGNRDKSEANLANVVYEGSYDMYGRLESLPTLLAAALGSSSSADNTSWHRHTITALDGLNLPWLSIEEAIADSFEVAHFTDARVNSLTISADAEGYLMVQADVVAIDAVYGQTRTNLAVAPANAYVDGAPLIVGSEIVVTHGGLSVCAKSIEVTINNQFDTTDYCLGQLGVDTFTPKEREITAALVIRPDDANLWREANLGAAGATAPVAGVAVQKELDIEVTSNTLIDGSQPYRLNLNIPAVSTEPVEVGASGDDDIELSLSMRGLRPDPSVAIMTAEVDNGLAAVA